MSPVTLEVFTPLSNDDRDGGRGGGDKDRIMISMVKNKDKDGITRNIPTQLDVRASSMTNNQRTINANEKII